MTLKRDAMRAKAAKAYRILAGLPEDAEDEDDIAGAKSPRTMLQYFSVWGLFCEWCEAEGLQSMPAAATTLRRYVRHLRKQGFTAASVDGYLAAITAVHRYRGHSVDRTILIEPLKSLRRNAGAARRAHPLWRDDLRDLLARLDPNKPRDVRDRALLYLGWTTALRECELAGLDWLRWGGWYGGGTGVVSLDPAGVLVTLMTSKTSQVEPVSLPVPDKEAPSLRPWLEAWVAMAKVQPGEPLFRQVDRWQRPDTARIASVRVSKIIHARVYDYEIARGRSEAEALGIARRFTGHSLRRGYCSSAARAGHALSLIRDRSRHEDVRVVARYIATESGWAGASLKGLGF